MSLRGGALPPTLAPYASAVSNLLIVQGDCFTNTARNDMETRKYNYE